MSHSNLGCLPKGKNTRCHCARSVIPRYVIGTYIHYTAYFSSYGGVYGVPFEPGLSPERQEYTLPLRSFRYPAVRYRYAYPGRSEWNWLCRGILCPIRTWVVSRKARIHVATALVPLSRGTLSVRISTTQRTSVLMEGYTVSHSNLGCLPKGKNTRCHCARSVIPRYVIGTHIQGEVNGIGYVGVYYVPFEPGLSPERQEYTLPLRSFRYPAVRYRYVYPLHSVLQFLWRGIRCPIRTWVVSRKARIHVATALVPLSRGTLSVRI